MQWLDSLGIHNTWPDIQSGTLLSVPGAERSVGRITPEAHLSVGLTPATEM